MADDRPYWVTSGNEPLLELPGHWSLCDWPYFGWTSYQGGLLADPAAVERIWLAEFESARQDRRAVTYTMHPEAIGRGYLVRMLDSVITAMAGGAARGSPPTRRSRTWLAPHPLTIPCRPTRDCDMLLWILMNQTPVLPASTGEKSDG